MPGPPPRRSSERRRANAPASGPPVRVDIEGLEAEDENSLPFLIKQPIVIPQPVEGWESADFDEADDDRKGAWHPIARELWDSFSRSGQALFWEPSDWAIAKLLCESISRDLKPQVVGVAPATEYGPAEVVRERIPMKGASLGAYLKAFGQLMLTEGERRRLSIELERTRMETGEGKPAEVVPITDRRQARLVIAARREASS